MSALDDFLWEHRVGDPPFRFEAPPGAVEASGFSPTRYGGAGYTALYDAYAAYCKAEDRPAVNHRVFRAALAAAGHESRKVEQGLIYPTLSLESRREIAERATLRRFESAAWHLAHAVALAEHHERRHADGSDCDHDLPETAVAAVSARAEASVARSVADGTVAAMVEVIYGPYLRQRPGEPDPGLVDDYRSALRVVAALDAEVAALRANLEALRASEPEPGGEGHWTPYDQWKAKVAEATPPLDRKVAERDKAWARLARIATDVFPPEQEAAPASAQARQEWARQESQEPVYGDPDQW